MKFLQTVLLALTLSFAASAQTVPQFKHVIVIPFENHSYSQVVGNSAMPYFNQLADQYGLATGFYAQTHPSLGNYFRLTTGQTITNNDSYTSTVTLDNVVREALSAGKTWKNYAENVPYIGYDGGDQYPYTEHHNPQTYFSDVRNNSTQRGRLQGLSNFQSDLANDALPGFAMLVPNNHHNGHDCPTSSSCTDYEKLRAADSWLQIYVSPLLDDSARMRDTLVILWWDEGASTDTANGGGHVALVLISPLVKANYRSGTFYRDDNLLKTIGLGLGFKAYPGNSANVAPMSDFFSGSSTTTPTNSGATGAFTGRLVNAATGGGISGASVSWSGGSTFTGTTGSFTLSGLPPGTDALAFKAGGYIAEIYPVIIASGATSTGTLKLATGGKLSGTVKTSSGAAITGATVRFSGGLVADSGSLSATSSGYLSNWIPIGSYQVTATYNGNSQTKPVTVNTGSTSSLSFTF